MEKAEQGEATENEVVWWAELLAVVPKVPCLVPRSCVFTHVIIFYGTTGLKTWSYPDGSNLTRDILESGAFPSVDVRTTW